MASRDVGMNFVTKGAGSSGARGNRKCGGNQPIQFLLLFKTCDTLRKTASGVPRAFSRLRLVRDEIVLRKQLFDRIANLCRR
jgi:hypothetical protein